MLQKTELANTCLILGTTSINVSLECFFYDKQALFVENPSQNLRHLVQVFHLVSFTDRIASTAVKNATLMASGGLFGSTWKQLHLSDR